MNYQALVNENLFALLHCYIQSFPRIERDYTEALETTSVSIVFILHSDFITLAKHISDDSGV